MNTPRLIVIPAILAVLVIVSVAFDFHTTRTNAQTAAAAAPTQTPPPPHVTAQSAIIYDVPSGTVLYAKNEAVQLPLASITKLMTAVVVRETLQSDDVIAIAPEALERDGDSGLLAQQLWRVGSLLDLTLVESSNDGAQALALAAASPIRTKYPGASPDAFVWRMNDLAQTLGLTQTYYLDPTGLDVSDTMASAYGSALDVAHLIAYMVKAYPDLLSATSERSIEVSDASGTTYTVLNTDKATDIPGLIGGKTGYTDLAGGNLAIVFDADIGHPVIVVALHSTKEGRFEDVRALTEYAHTLITERSQ